METITNQIVYDEKYIKGLVDGLLCFMDTNLDIESKVALSTSKLTMEVTLNMKYWPHEKEYLFYIWPDSSINFVLESLELNINEMNKFIARL